MKMSEFRKPVLVLSMILAVMGTLLLYPFESTVVPQWRVRVLDEAGNSVRGERLRESWSDYSVESHDHTEDRSTDGNGYVTFPRRTVKANLLVRLARKAFIAMVPHQGEGRPTAYILVLGDYTAVSDEPYYVTGRPLPTQIVVGPPRASSP
jgi:hypothetical protein